MKYEIRTIKLLVPAGDDTWMDLLSNLRDDSDYNIIEWGNEGGTVFESRPAAAAAWAELFPEDEDRLAFPPDKPYTVPNTQEIEYLYNRLRDPCPEAAALIQNPGTPFSAEDAWAAVEVCMRSGVPEPLWRYFCGVLNQAMKPT